MSDLDQPTTPAQLKAELRRAAQARRNALIGRANMSTAICARLLGLEQFVAAPAIHCFLPIRSEVDTRPIVAAALAAGKAVAIPVTVGGALEHSWIDGLEPAQFTPGALGTPRPHTLRPARPGDWSLTIVPMLAFDRACYRVGYGKGLYDKLLATTTGHTIGVAFSAQEVAALPHEAHDIPLDLIITERELIYPR
jgi:5-formyltetrahydrofolate cyclo-ligase